jgi:hypothetical protein
MGGEEGEMMMMVMLQ